MSDRASETRASLKVRQAYRFGKSDADHIGRLLHWAQIPAEAKLIDLGSASGVVASIITQFRPDIACTLIDIDAKELAKADPQFSSHNANICDVPLPDQSFDAALCCYASGYVAAEPFFAEAARLLRPDGILFLVDLGPLDPSQVDMKLFGYHPRTPQQVKTAASTAGFEIDFYLEPTDRSGWGKEIFGASFEVLFGDVKPVIWRMIKTA